MSGELLAATKASAPRTPREELGLGLQVLIRLIRLTIIGLLWFFRRRSRRPQHASIG